MTVVTALPVFTRVQVGWAPEAILSLRFKGVQMQFILSISSAALNAIGSIEN